ncbi:MAG: acyl-CoA/acyl-ACP dehydrogenase [Dehalococcoidales bacterium]|nr:acyl-CoA/acyl-ACP dehydrogenase [Dehalococcoidales bacterium]
MDFALNEQQEMMQTLARDFLTGEYPEKVLRAMAADEKGYTPELWKKLAEMNLLGLSIPEEYGGVGDFLDLIVVLEEMGRVCFLNPFFSSVVLGASAIIEAGSEKQKQEYLPGIAEGKTIITLALTEESAKYTPDAIQTRATPQGNDFIINGTKLFVTDANVADYLICVARTRETDNPQNGISLFMVDLKMPGVSCNPLKTISGDKQAEVTFDNVKVSGDNVLGEIDEGWPRVEKVLQKANVARCAEMVGLAQQALNMSLDYAKERIAFGHPIGAFQSIQHRCADMLIDVDGSRFATYQAGWRINEGLPAASEAAIAKAWVSQACRRVMNSAHQVHGAIGFTEDHILPFYTKKARASEFSFGGVDYHLEQLAVEY